MAHPKIVAFAAAALVAGLSGQASAQQPGAARVVGKELPAQAKAGEVGRACGIVHQEGRTGCTHHGLFSRRSILSWIGSNPDDEGKLTAEERAELDAMLASGRPIHDRRTSTFIKIEMATEDELKAAGPAGGACPGMPPVADTPAGRQGHWFGRSRKGDSCHWAYGSKKVDR